MSRYAAIDIGSNSSLLLIVERQPGGEVTVLVDTKLSTRLSSGVETSGAITESAIARQFEALDRFNAILHQNDVREVAVCGTQVYRIAENGADLADQIGRKYGWEMTIISGSEEANLSYLAATSGLSGIPDRHLVIDVGGGSTEVVYGITNTVVECESYKVGAVNLAESCQLTGVSDEQALDAATTRIATLIAPNSLEGLPTELEMIAVGGTASTLAAMNLGLQVFNPEAIHGAKLSREWLIQTVSDLAGQTVEARRQRLAFDPDRAEIIVAGGLIIRYLMEKLDLNSLTVSNRGLRYGLLVSRFPFLEIWAIKQKLWE